MHDTYCKKISQKQKQQFENDMKQSSMTHQTIVH